MRGLWKSPGFAIPALLTLSLGIGATSAIFSVVKAVLLTPLPYEAPDERVMLWSKCLHSRRRADRSQVLGMVLRQGLLFAAIGIAAGLIGAYALTRLMESLLYKVRPNDPLTFAAVATTALLIALVASFLPARRATRVSPIIALRAD